MPPRSARFTRRPLVVPALFAALAMALGVADGAAASGGTSGAASAPTARSMGRAGSMFHVGSPSHPLMEQGPVGPLWSASAPSTPGRASHGTFGAIYVAEQLAKQAASAAGDQSPATREAATSTPLTTAQATRKLSKTCQKLIKAKTSTLSRANRKRRTACLAQRHKLVTASERSPATTPATSVSAPAAPIQGPTPIPATTSSTSPTPVPTPTPTPAPGSTTPTKAPIDPSTVVCSAVGVTAIDIQPFGLTRGVACNDSGGNVDFQFTNQDAQVHGIAIKATGAADSTARVIIASLDPHSGPVSQLVSLQPGNYTLLCTVTAHNPMMEVQLKVLTKADYIAQGYAG
jgi:hypothetical protein